MNFTMPKNQNGQAKTNSWLRLLYWGLVVAGIWFAYLNIQPYERAVSFLGAKATSSAFISLVASIPLLNGIAAIFSKSLSWILGAILWSVIQIIEILPLILYNNEKFIEKIVTEADGRSRYQEKDTDDPTLIMLKRTYNHLPISVVSNLEVLKIFTYTVDFMICLTVYSPVASGKISDLIFILATGQWGKLDYGNLALALVTLFAIEVIVSLIIWVGKLSYAIIP
ncbi:MULTISPECIES: hypothetical protein [Nostoc]|uniref:Uncharacterized protein n=2 Tax=Nostoc TaxID=1177 RepID=A0ABR8IF62_9NOSO|nr:MULTISPECIES: hypothetical protein [Nostoc]MBD2565908.1 hypothetical protein [Nostoc linckia FACHB-391]MBD2649874.1 hypothetical protein [Nostoc foliaceum FACHB-393]